MCLSVFGLAVAWVPNPRYQIPDTRSHIPRFKPCFASGKPHKMNESEQNQRH